MRAPTFVAVLSLIACIQSSARAEGIRDWEDLERQGWLLHRSGKSAAAVPFLERALAAKEQALGRTGPGVIETATNLAIVYGEAGDFARSDKAFERALDDLGIKTITSDSPLPETETVRYVVENCGRMMRKKGALREAAVLLARALALGEKLHGKESKEVARALNNLALAHSEMGRADKALPLLERSLAIEERLHGKDAPETSAALTNLAATQVKLDDPAKARKLLARAAAALRKAKERDDRSLTTVVSNIAWLDMRLGRWADAARGFEQALKGIDALGAHAELEAEVNVVTGLASARAFLGQTDRAIELAERAAGASEASIASVIATGSERTKADFLGLKNAEQDFLIWLHLDRAKRNERAARLALETVLRRKGRALDAFARGISLLRERDDAHDRRLLDDLLRVRSRLATERWAGTAKPDVVGPLEMEARALEAKVSAEVAEMRREDRAVRLEDVQGALPNGAVLLEMVEYRPHDPTRKPSVSPPRRYAGAVLRRSGAPRFVDLGDAEAIDALARRFRDALASEGGSTGRGLTRIGRVAGVEEVNRLGRALGDQLVRPVRALLGTDRRVFIAPDGALNLIPFAALSGEDGRHLIEDLDFVYLTTGRDLVRIAKLYTPERAQAEALAALAGARAAPVLLADPDYGPRDAAAEGLAFDPLPNTAVEAKAIAALWPGAQLLERGGATELATKAVKSPPILHIATHGFFLAQKTDGGPASLANPLLRSVLALAGANGRKSGTEDGLLTALEVAALQLSGTKLVVLSACETGLGELRFGGEGVYGLRRALVIAGAESQVMTLWEVNDAATADLMIDFYRRIKEGGGRSEALRQAQLAVRARPERSHPFYWAAFIPSGDPRPLDGSEAGPPAAAQ